MKPQRASKSTSQERPETVSDSFHDPSLKLLFFSCFLVASVTTLICNPIVKTQVVLQIITSQLFLFLLISINRPSLRKTSKNGPRDVRKPLQNDLRVWKTVASASDTSFSAVLLRTCPPKAKPFRCFEPSKRKPKLSESTFGLSKRTRGHRTSFLACFGTIFQKKSCDFDFIGPLWTCRNTLRASTWCKFHRRLV